MSAPISSNAREFGRAVVALARELSRASPDGVVLGSQLGAEINARFGATALAGVGFSKLMVFLEACCPELKLQKTPAGPLYISFIEAPHTYVATKTEVDRPSSATSVKVSGVEGAPRNLETNEDGGAEWIGLTAVNWSLQASQWLQSRYAAPVTDPSEGPDDVKASLRKALGTFAAGNFDSTVSIVAPYVTGIIQETRSTGVFLGQRRLLVTLCRADSELAIDRADWAVAGDLILAALEIAGDVEGLIDPWRYSQVLAAAYGNADALESTPDELAQTASPVVIRALALGSARVGALGESLVESMLGGRRSKLYFSTREAVIDLIQQHTGARDVPKRRKELEYEAFRLLTDIVRECRTRSTEYREMIAVATGETLQTHAENLVGHLGRSRGLLFPWEQASILSVQPLLTKELSRYVRSASLTPDEAVAALSAHSAFGQALEAAHETLRAGGLMASNVLAPTIRYVSGLVAQSIKEASHRRRPELQIRKLTRRYPLQRTNKDIPILLEVQNIGPGPAEDVTLRIGPLPEGVDPKECVLNCGRIGAGAEATRPLTLNLEDALRSLRIPVEIRCVDVLGEPVVVSEDIVIEAQVGDPDWDGLLARAPYTLQPVEEPQNLRGRQAQIDKLRVNVATQTSTIVWGQKRVGKTSVARVFFHGLSGRNDIVALYLRKGDVAGYDEGAFAHELAERLVQEFRVRGLTRREVEVPSIGDFGGRLTRLTRVVQNIRDAGASQPIILVLDEFDELNPAFYRGQRGENFFGTLRALSEQRVVFVLVGSERMPAILRRYAQLMNKYDTLQIDVIDHTPDLFEMIQQPVTGYIEFDREAVHRVAALSGGNPYYVNLICTRILHAMVSARRTYVDPVDVGRGAAGLAEDRSPTHWSHLWEDGEADDEVVVQQRRRQAAIVLAGFGRQPSSRALRAAEIASHLSEDLDGALPDGVAIEEMLASLVGRRVLRAEGAGNERRFNLSFEIVRLWLCENAKTELLLPYRQADTSGVVVADAVDGEKRVIAFASDFPLSDDELIPIAEGLYYRGKHIDAMQIKQWLRQFQDDARIILAFKLLAALRDRWYQDDAKVSLLLDKAYRLGLELAQEAGVIPTVVSSSRSRGEVTHFKSEYLRRDAFRGVIANVFVSYFGDGVKSGAEVARAIRKENRVASAGSLERAVDWLEREGDVDPKHKFVLVVDDFVGSGHQIARWGKEFLKRHGARVRVREAVEQRRIVFVPLLAFRQGLAVLGDEVPQLRTKAVTVLDESDQAFSVEAGIFGSDDERKIAEAVSRHIGSQLYRDNPLGWENLQALIVFPDVVPNATLPIFWSSGIVDDRPWRPVFSR